LKYFAGIKKVRTFAPAFEEQCSGERIRKSSLKDLHRQIRIVVQEASAFLGTWVKEANRHFYLMILQVLI